ncbi:PREDICTED: selenoprotein W-like [Priapulus caudatus]|uniref:Selenoprotein W-like n=1 Tax=Priapulus caudatus TaxID=37621 RepID=A0ABM1F0K9_PRICU|nr:PREDICTED: selenoprotein W-like [Priapulus caudatus]
MKYIFITFKGGECGYYKEYADTYAKMHDHHLLKGHLIINAKETDEDVFEVDLVNLEMLHSKKNGDGFIDCDEKLEKIARGIKAHM